MKSNVFWRVMNHSDVSSLKPVHFFLLLKIIHENEKRKFSTKARLTERKTVNRFRMHFKGSWLAFMTRANIIHVCCIFMGDQIQNKQDNKEVYVINESKHNTPPAMTHRTLKIQRSGEITKTYIFSQDYKYHEGEMKFKAIMLHNFDGEGKLSTGKQLK